MLHKWSQYGKVWLVNFKELLNWYEFFCKVHWTRKVYMNRHCNICQSSHYKCLIWFFFFQTISPLLFNINENVWRLFSLTGSFTPLFEDLCSFYYLGISLGSVVRCMTGNLKSPETSLTGSSRFFCWIVFLARHFRAPVRPCMKFSFKHLHWNYSSSFDEVLQKINDPAMVLFRIFWKTSCHGNKVKKKEIFEKETIMASGY